MRLTAQRIFSNPLDLDDEGTFWEYIDLDLSGATLIDFNLFKRCVHTADFSEALLTGDTWFLECTFSGIGDVTDALVVTDVSFEA